MCKVNSLTTLPKNKDIVITRGQSHSRQEDRKSVSEIQETLNKIEKAQERKLMMIEAPSDIYPYIDLWGGFENDDYTAFNPAYRIELKWKLSKDDNVVEKVFVPRYLSPHWRARYLFPIKDEDGLRDLEKFVEIMRKVKNKCNLVDKKLHIRIARKKLATDYTEFYVGKQRGKETCIIEPTPSDKVLSKGRGDPIYYFITNDKDMYKKYLEWFDCEWDIAEEIVDRNAKDYRGNYIECLDDKVKMLRRNFSNSQGVQPPN